VKTTAQANNGGAKADEGHRFRSKLIDKLARAESLLNTLLQNDASANKTKVRKIPHLLGLKLEEVRKLTKSAPERFRSWERAEELLEQLKPFVDLRSKLAHSVLSVGTTETGTRLFIYDFTSVRRGSDWQARVAIREDECSTIIAEVSSLVNRLKQQVV